MQTAEQQLLMSIQQLLVQGEDSLSLPLSKLNSGIAQLSEENSKIVAKLQGKIIKAIAHRTRENSDYLDTLGVHILAPLQNWQDENHLLLTQLTAKAGLTQPGDPLESALLDQVAAVPELAYSATLLLALRDFLPHVGELIEVLKEIRDRMPPSPIAVEGELPSEELADEPEETVSVVEPVETETRPPFSW